MFLFLSKFFDIAAWLMKLIDNFEIKVLFSKKLGRMDMNEFENILCSIK